MQLAGDTILVHDGTYTENITENLVVSNNGPNVTILSQVTIVGHLYFNNSKQMTLYDGFTCGEEIQW